MLLLVRLVVLVVVAEVDEPGPRAVGQNEDEAQQVPYDELGTFDLI